MMQWYNVEVVLLLQSSCHSCAVTSDSEQSRAVRLPQSNFSQETEKLLLHKLLSNSEVRKLLQMHPTALCVVKVKL